MSDRVRAVLITEENRLLTIKRVKPGQAPYWVLPGGGVDPADASLEAALHREIREELGGQANIHSLVRVLHHDSERHYIYLARIQSWDFANRSGPEFREKGRGEYILAEISLTSSDLTRIDLVPSEIRGLLAREGIDVFRLPDLRIALHLRR